MIVVNMQPCRLGICFPVMVSRSTTAEAMKEGTMSEKWTIMEIVSNCLMASTAMQASVPEMRNMKRDCALDARTMRVAS